MVPQPILNSLQNMAGPNLGLGLKGSLHRSHYSSGPSSGGYHQHHHHIYHESGGHEHGGKKRSIALSALTLLSFLFFLNILQNCLEEQMDMITNPQTQQQQAQQLLLLTTKLNRLKQPLVGAKSDALDVEEEDERIFQKIQSSQRRSDHYTNGLSNVTVKIIKNRGGL